MSKSFPNAVDTRLRVEASHLPLVEKLFSDENIAIDVLTFDSVEGIDLAVLLFRELAAGRVPLQDELKTRGIAFESTWEAGDGIEPGTESLRFGDTGDPCFTTVLDAERSLPLASIRHHIDELGPAGFVAHLDALIRRVTVLPWTNQIAYGKRYLMRRLITEED